MDPDVVIVPARLQQQHAVARIGAEAIGQNAACGSRSNDYIVELSLIYHVFILNLFRSLYGA
jgi:hypothetical protein